LHLLPLIGAELRTLSGKPNRVIAVTGDAVTVGTSKSPNGRSVPIAWIQHAMDKLERDGEIAIDVATVGYRSAFIGAVLLTLPGAVVLATSPPRIQMRDRIG
jgi:hypothetical protein